jgi:hypothetical protein
MCAYQVNNRKAFSRRTITVSKAKYVEVYKILPGTGTLLTYKSDTQYFKPD